MIAMNKKNQETEMPKPLVEKADHKETSFSDDGAGEWQIISNSLRKSIGSDAFQRWFGVATWHSTSNGEGVVTVPGEIHQVWIETNYLPELMMAASEECEGMHHVKIMVAEIASDFSEENISSDNAPPQIRIELPSDMLEKRAKAAGLNPDYTFNKFVVGSNSQFAHAACEAVATKTCVGYNPLFIHGGSGLGKTHLMHAVGNALRARSPNAKIVYLHSERFVADMVKALQLNAINEFKRFYRSLDALLIDDIQFIIGKEYTQEEFFHTFNALFMSMDKSITKEQKHVFFKEGGTITKITYNSQF